MTITDNENKEIEVDMGKLDEAIQQAKDYSEIGDNSVRWERVRNEYWKDILEKLTKLKTTDNPD